MHQSNILHRDIKAANILCRSNGDIKLADLGVSTYIAQDQLLRETRLGTPSFVSPEIAAEGKKYAKEVDVWAYGCFAFELVTGGNTPFS